MKFYFLFILLFIISCERAPLEIVKISDALCIDMCLEIKFEKFFKSNSQLLGASSTAALNGMIQTDIYLILRKECEAVHCYSVGGPLNAYTQFRLMHPSCELKINSSYITRPTDIWLCYP